MTRANRVESFKDDTHTNREPFHVCSGMCTDLCVSPLSLGVQGTVVDRDVSDTCVSREFFFRNHGVMALWRMTMEIWMEEMSLLERSEVCPATWIWKANSACR